MKLLLLLTAILVSLFSAAQYGTLDSTFGQNGKITSEIYNYCNAVTLQQDGKIVAAGIGFQEQSNTSGFVLFRYLTDGTPDTSFGSSGRVAINFPAYQNEILYDIAIQPDGRILAVGEATQHDRTGFDTLDILLVRYLPNGSLDSSFGTDGITIAKVFSSNSGRAVTIQQDGKIIVSGRLLYFHPFPDPNYDFYSSVMRFLPDGMIDNSFGTEGKTLTKWILGCEIHDATLQQDGKVLIAGQETDVNSDKNYFLLQRYNTDGTPDMTFGTDGIATFSYTHHDDAAYAVHVLSNGKILTGGTVNVYSSTPSPAMGVARVNPDGTIDKTFGKDGWAVAALQQNQVAYAAGDMVVLSNGSIVLGGSLTTDKFKRDEHTDFALAGFIADGMIDSAFGDNGITITPFLNTNTLSALALQTDSKIVAAGTAYPNNFSGNGSFALARYNVSDNGQHSIIAKLKRFLHNHGITWNGNSNFAYYSVERSSGKGFREVSRISSSNNQQSYNYIIPSTPSSNTTAITEQYRIRAVGNTGQSNLSNVVAVSNEADDAQTINVYPNPVSSTLTVKGLNASMNYKVTVTDISGTVYLTTTIKQQTTATLDVNRLKRGNYVLNVSNSNTNTTLKFVKE